MIDTWTMPGGLVLHNVHPKDRCEGRPCIIHNPLSTHMDSWPLIWRADRGIFERKCEHEVGHPAPEQAGLYAGIMVHGCDGCCG